MGAIVAVCSIGTGSGTGRLAVGAGWGVRARGQIGAGRPLSKGRARGVAGPADRRHAREARAIAEDPLVAREQSHVASVALLSADLRGIGVDELKASAA